jgi:hypothetical protein
MVASLLKGELEAKHSVTKSELVEKLLVILSTTVF